MAMADPTPTPTLIAEAHVTTSFLLSNLHCPTCVTSIKNALRQTCGPDIIWVSPNVVTSVVTVEHRDTPAASIRIMAKALEDIGFDINGVASTAAAAEDDVRMLDRVAQVDPGESSRDMLQGQGAADGWSCLPRRNRSRDHASKVNAHLENCELCRKSSHLGRPHAFGSEKKPVNQLDDLGAPRMADKPSVTELESVAVAAPGAPAWRATLAVGGMTCAVCVNAITEELKKRPWISNTAVNLVSNSATVDFTEEERAADIVSTIEDLGYEAAIDNVVNLAKEKDVADQRTVEIKIDGIFCPQCPARLTHSLEGFRRRLAVVSPPTIQRPIVKISYTPEAPGFTIRHILTAIEATDTAFTASIYHPPTLEERSKLITARHQKQLLYRVIFTAGVAVPTFVIGIVYMSLLSHENASRYFLMKAWTSGLSRAQIALFILATPVYFFAADIFHTRAVKEIRAMWRRGSRTPVLQRFYRFGSMNMLMSLGTTIAYVSSVSQMIAAAVLKPEEVEDNRFYFDSVVFLTLFLLLGRLIESYSKSKTGDAVDMLGRLRPSSAVLVEVSKGAERDMTVAMDHLEFGDIIRIPHGASPAADATIVQGETTFDESSLTGESRPVKKTTGDAVFAGTMNKGGPVLARITGIGGTSMLDQIVKVVRDGQTKRAPMEQIADVMTTYFVPVITLIAIITWVVWMVLGFSGGVPGHFLDNASGWVAFALQFAIAVFVVACPCGLALAAPTAIFVGGGLAAKHGILAKGGGEAFEKASKIDCVVFDKTGTLTLGGEPQVTESVTYPDTDSDDAQVTRMLTALRAVEENSSHPIAKAIVAFCASRTTTKSEVEAIEEIPGRGMKAAFGGDIPELSFDILVGNEALMRESGVVLSSDVASLLETWKGEAKSVALVATKSLSESSAWILAAALSISDPIRPEALPIIKVLRQRGTKVWMLSGDNEVTAKAVAQRVGIETTNVLAEVLPSQKAEKIKYLQTTLKGSAGRNKESSRRAMVAMVGDGINDSPALTMADIGVAIGSGSDIAISSADFVLVKSDLRAVVTLLDLSRIVFRRIKFNFGWAVIFNLIAVPVAAGVLYPVKPNGTHVRLDPVWASLAMALSSISVVTSSLALRSKIPGVGFKVRKIGLPSEENTH